MHLNGERPCPLSRRTVDCPCANSMPETDFALDFEISICNCYRYLFAKLLD